MINVVKIGLASVLFLLVGGNSAHAALATDCTLYAAAYGNNANSGISPTAPKTLQGASKASVPGSVICLRGGTYYLSQPFRPTKSGAASAWIVYKNYGDGNVLIQWTGTNQVNMFHFYSTTLSSSSLSYIEIRGLQFDGRNTATVALSCQNSHHLRFVGNKIQNMGSAGLGGTSCDYLTAERNQITHVGYNQGWASGITYHTSQWLDTAPGFHSFVVNNIISGSYDASIHRTYGHTDGHGIIMDRSNSSNTDLASANTPPVLIANNVVYENGEYCIITWAVSNIWVVNNTCYKNSLDLKMHLQHTPGEVRASNSKNSYFLNNLAHAWNNQETYGQGLTRNLTYYKDIYYGGSINFTYPDPTQFIKADPLFIDPPVLNPTKDGQYATALPPWQLGNSLALRGRSPAIDKGIDPTKLPGISAAIINGLRRYVLQDITGTHRPQGPRFDLGAYEYTP